MQPQLCPRLRPYLKPACDDRDPHHIYLVDLLGLSPQPQRLTYQEFYWLHLFDGQRTVADIRLEVMRQAGGLHLPFDIFATLVDKLEEALLLDSPRFRQIADNPVRPPRCIGCYEEDPTLLRQQLAQYFLSKFGPGKPGPFKPGGRLRAALLPHIDYGRGGHTYAWGFKEVVERTDASLFVIVGTSHYSSHRFTLTRKNFQTPLGIVPTDQGYIDRLVKHYGHGLFNDEWMAHFPEHSIELEVVFLQYLYEQRRPIRIVPLVVGSFADCVAEREKPLRQPDIRAMVEALRRTEAETKEPICYIISGDLAHIGPKFGDADRLVSPFLNASRQQDQAILQQAAKADAAGFFQVIAAEDDARRICGLPPTYVVLEAVRPSHGQVVHYDQYVHPRGFESVSFASMAFYQ